MERTRESWYERVEIKRATKDWVDLNCKLTDRELELLKLIYDRKLVRRDYLEVISPSYRVLGDNRGVILNRAIKKLFKLNVIDKVHESADIGKGNTPAIISIDKCGSMILGKPHKRRIIHRFSEHNGKTYVKRELPINHRHVNCINRLEVETILLCEEYECEIVDWQLEKPNSFIYGNENNTLIPDVLLILRVGNKKIPIYIEYDTGTEGIREKEPKAIKDKILKYKRFKSSKIWITQDWQSHFEQPLFPIVLFITEDEKRIDFFKRKSNEYNVKSLSMYYDKYSSVMRGFIKAITN